LRRYLPPIPFDEPVDLAMVCTGIF
jgi:hypothetical protein